ncbi:31681_t:CDS:2, partial [Gigaspora margarita]
ILHSSNPTIHLRVSGDGRNTGSKIKHIMITFMILNNINNHHHADHYYTTVFYPGAEKYNILTINLGINCANSQYFCLWYECAKEQYSNLNQNWCISKNMEKIAKDYKSFHKVRGTCLWNSTPLCGNDKMKVLQQ